jgi:hypothetical protein
MGPSIALMDLAREPRRFTIFSNDEPLTASKEAFLSELLSTETKKAFCDKVCLKYPGFVISWLALRALKKPMPSSSLNMWIRYCAEHLIQQCWPLNII